MPEPLAEAASKATFWIPGMTKLDNSHILRAGRTASSFRFEAGDVTIGPGSTNSLHLYFSIASKGGGITDLSINIGSSDFDQLLDLMINVSDDKFV
jgi:hypothetical protein